MTRMQTIRVEGVCVRCPWGEARRVRALFRAADAGGVIQAGAMLPLFPGEPTRHTATRLDHALSAIGAEIKS